MQRPATTGVHFGDEMTQEAWHRVARKLEPLLGEAAIKNWISPLTFESAHSGLLTLRAPTSFMGNWVERNHGKAICQLMSQEGVPVSRITFAVGNCAATHDTPLETNNLENLASNATSVEHADVMLDKRFTFDRFVVGKPNELAHAAAKRVAESAVVSFNPLFLYSGVGLGKTHLMHAIAWELRERNPSAKVLYLSAEQFMHRFIQALRFKDMLTFKDMFRSVDVLMVDDVQFIAGKDSTQDEFFHTFNALIDQNKQIVISADRSPGEIDGIDERIKSRLQWGLVVDIHPTDYELRLGILQSKAEAGREFYGDVQMAPGVIEFLAHRISSNVRVLEGALTRLLAWGDLTRNEITIEHARDVLADIIRVSEKKVTIDEIIRKVADHYNLRVNDILSARRSRNVARPRQVAMYLAKQLTSKSLPEIGRRFGGRDHTTVIHAVKKITELKISDPTIEEDVELLRRALEG